MSPVDLRIASNDHFTRLEFRGPLGVRAGVRQSGVTLAITLPRGSAPELARLRLDPPAGVIGVDTRQGQDAYVISLTLAPDASARWGRADGAVWVNLYPPQNALDAPIGGSAKAPPPSRAVVKASADAPDSSAPATLEAPPTAATVAFSRTGDRAELRFSFPAPVKAAAFRRGAHVWIVFDTPARLALPAIKDPAVSNPRAAANADALAIRLDSPASTPLALDGDGKTWRLRFGGPPTLATQGPPVERDDQTGPPALQVALAAAGKVVWIRDPVVGDRIAVVTAPAPAKPMTRDRIFIQAALPRTLHGLLVEVLSPDVRVEANGDTVRVFRPGGLALSPKLGASPDPMADMPVHARLPAVIDPSWGKAGPDGFLKRWRQLQSLAAAEAAMGDKAPVKARMAYVRFLIGVELNHEAIGVLDALAKARPEALDDPEARGLRGAARSMVGRWAEAENDLTSGALEGDPSAALWRGLTETRMGRFADAQKSFERGAPAVDLMPPVWRSRFAVAHAVAAMETGQVDAAPPLLAFARAQKALPARDQLDALMAQARLFEMRGDRARALAVYEALARAGSDAVAARAGMEATRLRLALGRVGPDKAIRALEALRYRWRGDGFEIDLVRAIGRMQLSQGLYREAMQTLRSAGRRLPTLPAAAALRSDLAGAFRALFLDGRADALEPIQAVALFFDFRDLTPIGAEGDDMVRRLARRLVSVDLLPQASELLKYQVENRLDGVARAQVATDLATVYLMDRKPEAALQSLWGTRTTLLPQALNAERRLLEARALHDLGRNDHALEVLGTDASPQALDLRAEIAWTAKAWAQAGQLYEKRLGDRFKTKTPLTGEEESWLIRAGAAFSLAGDAKALARLSGRFGPFIATARAPEAVRIALEGLDGETYGAADVARAAAQADTFAGWVAQMKARFRAPSPPTPSPAAAATAAKNPAAPAA